MVRQVLALSIVAITASGLSSQSQVQTQNPRPTFRGGVRTVEVYATVQDRGLHQRYAIGFDSVGADGTVHTLDVRVKRPGLIVRAPRHYRSDR